ncbi:MAG: type IX secretion system membrane protein PorP/SprF [Flavobacteriales bacterium]|jgi:type IX secretion system PorP/SprF family membrane protein|nr:type IX secretion system membrane protein PorP/SprF [Flavobacteriales bacterium]MCB0758961.1 type IX secretion system membrane protein PorP/SprF [Flavobacteriales bacterium]
MRIWTGRSVALGLALSLLGTLSALAQDPQFTQFYANPLYLNPAFAGTARCPRVSLNYRNQWPALSGTFVTTSASYDQDVRGIMGGLGLLITSDQAGKGTLNTTTVSGIYSYTQAVSRKFSIKAGFQATYFQKSLDWNKLTFGDQIDPRRGFIYATNDVPRGGSVGNADFSAGFLGYTDIFFVGIAANHLTEPNESLIVGTSKMPMKITAHGGAAIPLGMRGKYGEPKTKLSPNILYQQQAAFRQLNLGLYVDHGPIMAGVWYRSKDAFIALIGFHTDHLKFGYSYDVTTSKLTTATAGSHEISLTLQFDCKKKRRRVRTVPCPTF